MQIPKEEFIKFLGEGAYGCVNLVRYTTHDGSSFQAAVKHSYDEDFDNLHRELQILCKLRGDPRIVECLGDSLEQGSSPYGDQVHKLVLEYASEGSLGAFMDNYIDRKLPDSMIRNFTRMILQGLVSIHSHGFVHCDLKSDNLLVFPSGDDSFKLKISDFGNSLQVGDIPHYWAFDCPFVGTSIYMPPESLRDGVATKALDLWSLGCLVLEMYTGELPWQGASINDVTNLLLDGKAPQIPESVPCDAREFIETCFARNPEDRGSAYELLSHRFLPRQEEVKTIIAAETRDSSFSLRLKLKLRIRHALKKKSTNISDKKHLKLKFFPAKPPQFKKTLNKILRFKCISSVSVY